MTVQILEDPGSAVNPVLKVERPFYDKQQFNHALFYDNTKVKKAVLSNPMGNIKPFKILLSIFPIFSWLSQYNVKEDLISDIISGCTVGVMHIPQGLYMYTYVNYSFPFCECEF